jgi:hypothetical protein
MVAAYRLIKDRGHAAQIDDVSDVFLQLSRLLFRFLDIRVHGLEHSSYAMSLFWALKWVRLVVYIGWRKLHLDVVAVHPLRPLQISVFRK